MTLAILCPGQGGQSAAMFDPLVVDPAAQVALAEASAAAGFDPVAAARSSPNIFHNALAQPLICAYELAAWAALAPLVPAPALFAGYSVGELAAYGCAGALTTAGTVRLACERAALMDAASTEPAGLAAVRGLSRRSVEALCAACGTEIAIVNGEEHCIVGGSTVALNRLLPLAVARGASVQRLNVAIAAHTSLLAKATAGFRGVLEDSPITAPRTPVLAGTSGAVVRNRSAAIDILARQISTTLQWSACMDVAYEHGCRVFLELGPGNALSRMVGERFADVATRSLAEFRSAAGAAGWVARHM